MGEGLGKPTGGPSSKGEYPCGKKSCSQLNQVPKGGAVPTCQGEESRKSGLSGALHENSWGPGRRPNVQRERVKPFPTTGDSKLRPMGAGNGLKEEQISTTGPTIRVLKM